MIIWITGMAGSGKSSVASKLYNNIKIGHKSTVLLDGDVIRNVFGQDASLDNYSIAGRKINSSRIVELCKLLDCQDINVICAILSIFEDARMHNRSSFSSYYEVHLKCPYNVLRERRHLYKEAESGCMSNVVGVDLEYPRNTTHDIEFDTSLPDNSPDKICKVLLKKINLANLN